MPEAGAGYGAGGGCGRGGGVRHHERGYHCGLERVYRHRREGRHRQCRRHRGAWRIGAARWNAIRHSGRSPRRWHCAVFRRRGAEDHHERRQRHRLLQRGEGDEAICHRARRAQPGHLLRSCGFLHVREHVSGKVRVRVRAHRGGHADVSPVSRAVVREKPGDAS